MAAGAQDTRLPKLFHMDDYYGCIANKSLYCKAVGKLHPHINTSLVWTQMRNMAADPMLMDRTVAHRGLCLYNTNNSEPIFRQCEQLINDEMKEYDLTSQVFNVFCTDGQLPVEMTDYIAMSVTFLLLCTVTLATLLYGKTERNKTNFVNILLKFSLQHTWTKITKTDGNEDFQRLKSIQGIRVLLMILIIIFHSKMMYVLIYLSNPEWLEEINKGFYITYNTFVDLHLVHIFFLISSFLLANQIYKIKDSKKQFSLRDAFLIILNRFFRLNVAVIATIFIINSSFLRRLSGIATFEIVTVTQEACRNYWLPTILFYNNFYYNENLCNGVTWTNSADFQMYVIITLAFYLIFKYKLPQFAVMVFGLLFSMVIYGMILYYFESDVILKNIMRQMEFPNGFRSFPVHLTYMNTFAMWSTSFVGMILGSIYYKTKHMKLNFTKLASVIWYILFFGLPLIAVIIASKTYNRLQNAILGAVFKQIFVLGIGIGILGMTHNLGGTLRKILEWKYFVIFSNFTYCVYLNNWIMVITVFSTRSTPIYASWGTLILNGIVCIIKSITMGIILTIMVEQPGLSLQKYFLPQIRSHNDSNEKGKKK